MMTQARNDPNVAREYGNLVVELARTVPDGLICFFVSYTSMEQVTYLVPRFLYLHCVGINKLHLHGAGDVFSTTFSIPTRCGTK
jgi:DNA excision repair protein ERCC-2